MSTSLFDALMMEGGQDQPFPLPTDVPRTAARFARRLLRTPAGALARARASLTRSVSERPAEELARGHAWANTVLNMPGVSIRTRVRAFKLADDKHAPVVEVLTDLMARAYRDVWSRMRSLIALRGREREYAEDMATVYAGTERDTAAARQLRKMANDPAVDDVRAYFAKHTGLDDDFRYYGYAHNYVHEKREMKRIVQNVKARERARAGGACPKAKARVVRPPRYLFMPKDAPSPLVFTSRIERADYIIGYLPDVLESPGGEAFMHAAHAVQISGNYAPAEALVADQLCQITYQ